MWRGVRAIAQHGEQHDAPIGHDRKRVTGRSRQRLRAEERQQLVRETRAQRGALIVRQLRPKHDRQAVPADRSFADERLEQPVLPGNERTQPNRDRVERFLRAESVRGRPAALERHELLQGTDLRRHEVVQIGREDPKEAEPRGRRCARILGHGQHAGVELDPRQLRIEELLRCRPRGIDPVRCQDRGSQLAERDATGARDVRRREIVGRVTLPEGHARPFGDERRARRDGERGQGRGVAQHRRPDAVQQLGRGEPLQRRMTRSAQTPRRPDFERRAVAGRGHDAQQPQLTLTTAHDAAQRGATRRLATAVVQRNAQLGAQPAQSQTTMLDGEEGQLPFAPELTREDLCFRRIQRGLRAVQRIIAQRPQPAGGLIAARHDAGGHSSSPPRARPQRQLPQWRAQLAPPHRDRIAHDVAQREQHERHRDAAPAA